jgi:hypothetical protein
MSVTERTRIAILGTLIEFHREPIPYDISALMELVSGINPDLLCLDISPKQWKEQDFNALSREYQEALLPLARQTDIVVAPIGDGESLPITEAAGWRGKAVGWLRNWIAAIQRTASGPDAINQGWRHRSSNILYDAIRLLSSSDSERGALEHAAQLTQEVIELSRRDPGVRVLVVANVQQCHIIREQLREFGEVEVTTYTEL